MQLFFFSVVAWEPLSYPLRSFSSSSLFHYIFLGYVSKTTSFLVINSLNPQSNSLSLDFLLQFKLESILFLLSFQNQTSFLSFLPLVLLVKSWLFSIWSYSVLVDWLCLSFCFLKYSTNANLIFFRYVSYRLIGRIFIK